MKPTQMKWKTAMLSAGLLLSGLLAACGGGTTQGSTDDATESNWTLNHGEIAPTPSSSSDPGVAPEQGGNVEAAKNCAYIQWCDEPGAWGTVCRAKSGCASTSAIVAECDADVKAVCGKAVLPKRIDFY